MPHSSFTKYFVCIICNQKFMTTKTLLRHVNEVHQLDAMQYYMLVNEIKTIPKCPVCGNDVKFVNYYKGFRKYCSKLCAIKAKQITTPYNIKRGTAIKWQGKMWFARHHIRLDKTKDIHQQLVLQKKKGKIRSLKLVDCDELIKQQIKT